MKKMIKWLVMLIAGFALSANAAVISKLGSNWSVNNGGEITITAESVANNGYFAGGALVIGYMDSNNHLIIDNANVQVNGGSSEISIGGFSGRNNNMLVLTNGATISASSLQIGADGSSGNRVILGEESELTTSLNLYLYGNNTLEFAGGAASCGYLYIYTNSEIAVSGNYAVGDTLVSWSTKLGGGTSMIGTTAALLAKFNEAGAGRYEFGLGADGKSIRVIPDHFTVTFNGNGGTPPLQTNMLNAGDAYAAPVEPSRTEYKFSGWSLNGVPVTTMQTNVDHTVYAIWNPENFLWITNGGKLVITAYIGTNTAVTVPAFIDGLPVVEIGSGAFLNGHSNAHLIASVALGSNVVSIADYAFTGSGITTIDLTGVTNIGANAFCGSDLTTVKLDSGKTIYGDAFCDTDIPFIFIPTDAPSLIGNPIEESKVVYYLPHTTNWTQFIGKHSNTVALAGNIVETSIEDRTTGFAFDVLGIAGSGMILEAEVIATTTLTEPDWNRVGDTITNLTSVTPIEFVDPSATTNSSRFYKTRVIDAK